MKKTLFILLFFFWVSLGHSQILRNVSLNLNTGGEVFDAAYIPSIKRYIIVGNFSSVNGSTQLRHAFLYENGTLDTYTLGISSISGNNVVSGAFYSIEVIQNKIYIAGDFYLINGIARNGLLRYNVGGTDINPNLTNETTNLPPFAQGTILYDLALTGSSSLSTVGNFSLVGPPTNNFVYETLAEFTLGGFFTSRFSNPVVQTQFLGYILSSETKPKILYHKNNFYISGGRLTSNGLLHYGIKLNNSGQYLYHHNYYGASGGTADSKSFSVINDTVLIGGMSQGGAGIFYSQYVQTNSQANFSDNYPLIVRNGCSNNLSFYALETYNNSIYEIIQTPLNNADFKFSKSDYSFITSNIGSLGQTVPNLQLTSTFCQDLFENTSYNFDPNLSDHLFRAKNRLFLSSPKITGAGTVSSVGLLQYCLEPENPKQLNNLYDQIGAVGQPQPFQLDTVLCPGKWAKYTVPPSTGAEGYVWQYSGTGLKASFIVPPAGGFFDEGNYPFDLDSLGNTSNIIYVFVTDNFSPGNLTVRPYSTCNTATDYLFAGPETVPIIALPLPNINLIDSASFTCLVDTLLLSASSSPTNVSYEWYFENALISTASSYLLTGSDDPSVQSDSLGYFYVSVKNNTTGCKSRDSIWVSDDKYYDTLQLPTNLVTEFYCNTDSLEFNASVYNGIYPINSTIIWQIGSILTNTAPNPLWVPNADSTIKVIALHNTTGCSNSLSPTLSNAFTEIGGELSSHPGYTSGVADTLSCLNPTLSFVCVPDPSDVAASSSQANWIVNGIPIGNTLNLSMADTVGMNANNTKVYNYQTEHGITGCVQNSNVIVLFDLESPFVDLYLGPSSTNCSYDTLTLSHTPTFGNVSQGWLNGGTNTFVLDTLVQTAGTFVFEVMDTLNGCKSYDTTVVTQTLEMVLNGTSDTLVCPGLPFTISVLPQNVVEPINYVWSNGSFLNTTTGLGGVDTLLTVVGTSVSGCVGVDTILVEISEPISATFQGFTTCGSPNGSIQILTTSGGTGDYSYSMDNAIFTDSTNFGNLPMDSTYTIFIQDSIGCVYEFQTVLDATAQSPSMDFLMQTYNAVYDTVVAVNISEFQGFDSIAWFLPTAFTVLSVDDSMLVFQVADTGDFLITMVGYQDTCAFEFSKFLRVDYFKPTFNEETDTLGITSFNLSPNPTSGSFVVDVSFGKIQNFSIVVLTNLGQPIPGMSYSGNGNAINLPLTFPLGTATGNYRVRVICEYDTQQQSILKQ